MKGTLGAELSPEEVVRRVERIAEQIKPLLAGQPSVVQGAVLADLTSIWLAGHFPAELREALFDAHNKTVRQLVEPSEAEILACMQEGGSA